MSTILQKNLAREIVKNSKRKKPLNKGQLLEKSGYARKSATSVPTKIMNQTGVVEALNELGFSEEGAKKVVQSIMYDEEESAGDRLRATDQVFRVHKSYGEGGGGNNVNIVFMPPELLEKYGLKNNNLNTLPESNS